MASREARPRKPLGFFIMKYFIYYLHKGDNIPFYVGKTKNLKNRISGHRVKYGLDTIIEELEAVPQE
ncbi:MAG: GIY-YIG nuclease family protein, partial [Actinomycetia bacterium]|nr:GIY-YIG nuclease family protein [Actinomycetes bacterium]